MSLCQIDHNATPTSPKSKLKSSMEMGIPVSELAWISDLFLNSLFSWYKHQKGVGTNICNLTTWFMWRKSLIFGIKCVPISLPSAFPSSIQLCKIKYWYIIIDTHTARACIKNQTSNYAQKERENKRMLELINFSKKQKREGLTFGAKSKRMQWLHGHRPHVRPPQHYWIRPCILPILFPALFSVILSSCLS